MTFDRRSFMIGGAALAGAGVLSSVLKTGGANAAAPKVAKQAPGYYRTKVGKIEVTSLLDGGMTLGDSLMLGTTPEALAEAKNNNFLPKSDSFPAYLNGFVVNTGKKVTLIDTGGVGMAETLGGLIPNLASAGIEAAQVDEIILTHAHPDHTNGLLLSSGERAFAKAGVRIAQEELAFWFDDAQMEKYADKKMLFDLARKNLGPYKESGQIQTFKKGADFGGGLSAVALHGHTPGHSGVRISDGKEQLLIWGDIVHVPALQFTHPEAAIAFDTEPEAAKAVRAKIFDEVATDRLRVGGMHLVFPGLGHLAKRAEGYAFAPQQWETSV